MEKKPDDTAMDIWMKILQKTNGEIQIGNIQTTIIDFFKDKNSDIDIDKEILELKPKVEHIQNKILT